MEKQDVNKILVIQTGGWMGDMILLTPTLRALKLAYPQSHLALMLRPLVADVMASHPYLDEVIVDTKDQYRNRLKAIWNAAKAMRRSRFDLAIVLHPTSFRNALIPFLAGVPERVGSHVNGRGILLTQSCSDRKDLHEIHRYLRVLELIDIHEPDATLEFWHTDADGCAVRQMLADHGISPTDRVIGINPGTTWQTKRWRLEKFAAVATQVQNRLGIPLILTGSASEIPLGEALQQMTPAKLINLIGQTTLTQLGALIERCTLYLTCDSGPMHIAAAVGTPTIALFGPTSPTRHRPYGNGHCVIEKPIACRPCYKRTCQRKDAPNLCMTEIQVEEIVGEIIQMI